MIELSGGNGGLWEFKVSLLASRGFAALTLAYLNYDDIQELPSSMDMEYFEEAANWLSSHPEVLPHGIGVHAICYGSWAALLMASLKMKAVKAVVAISPVINAFPIPFSYKGKVSEILPFENSQKISTNEGSIWRYAIPAVNDVCTTVSNYSPITPVENISCPVLLAFGTGDLNVIPTLFNTELIFNRLKAHGKENLCSILCYPEAAHQIEPPYTPHCFASFSGITANYSSH